MRFNISSSQGLWLVVHGLAGSRITVGFFVDLMFKFGLEDALCFGFGRVGFGALGFAVEAWGLDFGN